MAFRPDSGSRPSRAVDEGTRIAEITEAYPSNSTRGPAPEKCCSRDVVLPLCGIFQKASAAVVGSRGGATSPPTSVVAACAGAGAARPQPPCSATLTLETPEPYTNPCPSPYTGPEPTFTVPRSYVWMITEETCKESSDTVRTEIEVINYNQEPLLL
ncbi:hypothetical protein KGM_216092 [Danaus plexippus plexippus]|uniref:Uncharacterized protein n=1 Tax=Danaus plexippus plexippus TaxID=278856 RepID=A0A212FLF7_DANPL|nr:hypothetical protein KGM_216092 [Danaus plexippus plexippus]